MGYPKHPNTSRGSVFEPPKKHTLNKKPKLRRYLDLYKVITGDGAQLLPRPRPPKPVSTHRGATTPPLRTHRAARESILRLRSLWSCPAVRPRVVPNKNSAPIIY